MAATPMTYTLGKLPDTLTPITPGEMYELHTGATIKVVSGYQRDEHGLYFVHDTFDLFSAAWFGVALRRYIEWRGTLPTSQAFSVGNVGRRLSESK